MSTHQRVLQRIQFFSPTKVLAERCSQRFSPQPFPSSFQVCLSLLVIVITMKIFKRYSRLAGKEKIESFAVDHAPKDTESVFSSSIMSTSVLTEATFGDSSTLNGSRITTATGRRRRIKKNRERRKRGRSLEREISMLILGTASSGASGAHFEVGKSSLSHESERSALAILKDLGEDVEIKKESRSTSPTTADCRTREDSMTRDLAVAADTDAHKVKIPIASAPEVYKDPEITLNLSQESSIEDKAKEELDIISEEPILSIKDDFQEDSMPLESFESISWRDSNSFSKEKKGITGAIKSPLQEKKNDAFSPRTPVVFKTNFDEWSKFEPAAFIEKTQSQYSDTLIDPDDFEVTPEAEASPLSQSPKNEDDNKSKHPKTQRKLPDPSPSRPPRVLYDEGSLRSREETTSAYEDHHPTYESFHPGSPDSIFDYPDASPPTQKGPRAIRLDPPAAHALQIPEAEVTRIMI